VGIIILQYLTGTIDVCQKYCNIITHSSYLYNNICVPPSGSEYTWANVII